MLLLALFSAPALAGDDDFFFVGGGLAIRPAYAANTFFLGAEAEADLSFKAGMVGGRLDLDFQGTVLPTLGYVPVLPDVPVINIVRPEWAMVEVTGESWAARGGIINAAFGLEDWDDWALYLPTHGQYYAFTPGRMAGGEFAWTFGDAGPTLALGGGLDLDWELPIVEATITVESDAYAIWSGVAVYPADQRYAAVLGAEAYPAEVVTLALGGIAGMDHTSPFANVSVSGVFLPAGMINPTVRVEGSFDPDAITGAAPFAASVGGAVSPTDWIKILVEGKMLLVGDDIVPGAYASLCVYRVSPPE